MRGQTGGAALAVLAAASCAAPSRQLTPRIVEDPITLPKRMASASLGVTAVHYEPTDAQGVLFTPGFRFGITDHLEWSDLLGLRYAFLDDRPADGRAPRPLSLALRAGVFGIGYSSAEGMIVLPVVSLTALKHVANRWALSLSAGWTAQWVEYPSSWTPAYSDSLVYSSRERSSLSLAVTVVRQLRERVALGVAPSIDQVTDCASPTCSWKTRGAGVSVFVGVRPLSWLTLYAGPAAGVRERSNVAGPVRYPDGTVIVVQPRTVTWVALSGTLAFYW
jgi:hypothetical protein